MNVEIQDPAKLKRLLRHAYQTGLLTEKNLAYYPVGYKQEEGVGTLKNKARPKVKSPAWTEVDLWRSLKALLSPDGKDDSILPLVQYLLSGHYRTLKLTAACRQQLEAVHRSLTVLGVQVQPQKQKLFQCSLQAQPPLFPLSLWRRFHAKPLSAWHRVLGRTQGTQGIKQLFWRGCYWLQGYRGLKEIHGLYQSVMRQVMYEESDLAVTPSCEGEQAKSLWRMKKALSEKFLLGFTQEIKGLNTLVQTKASPQAQSGLLARVALEMKKVESFCLGALLESLYLLRYENAQTVQAYQRKAIRQLQEGIFLPLLEGIQGEKVSFQVAMECICDRIGVHFQQALQETSKWLPVWKKAEGGVLRFKAHVEKAKDRLSQWRILHALSEEDLVIGVWHWLAAGENVGEFEDLLTYVQGLEDKDLLRDADSLALAYVKKQFPEQGEALAAWLSSLKSQPLSVEGAFSLDMPLRETWEKLLKLYAGSFSFLLSLGERETWARELPVLGKSFQKAQDRVKSLDLRVKVLALEYWEIKEMLKKFKAGQMASDERKAFDRAMAANYELLEGVKDIRLNAELALKRVEHCYQLYNKHQVQLGKVYEQSGLTEGFEKLNDLQEKVYAQGKSAILLKVVTLLRNILNYEKGLASLQPVREACLEALNKETEKKTDAAKRHTQVLLAEKKAWKAGKDASEYSGKEIESLLIKKLNSCLEWFEVFPATEAEEIEGVFIKRLEDLKKKRAETGKGVKVLFPFQLEWERECWGLLYIEYPALSEQPTRLYYFDPRGDAPGQSMVSLLAGCFKGLSFTRLEPRIQYEEYQSGPWVVETGAALCLGGINALPVAGSDIEALRHEHKRLLEKMPAKGLGLAGEMGFFQGKKDHSQAASTANRPDDRALSS